MFDGRRSFEEQKQGLDSRAEVARGHLGQRALAAGPLSSFPALFAWLASRPSSAFLSLRPLVAAFSRTADQA